MAKTKQPETYHAYHYYGDAWRTALYYLFGHVHPNSKELSAVVCTGRYESIDSVTYTNNGGRTVVTVRWSPIDNFWHVEVDWCDH